MAGRAARWLDVVACLILVGLAVQFGARRSVWYIGLCLTSAAMPIWLIARRQLGKAFSVRPEARRLVVHGLYSKLRHPIYIFGSLAFLGAFLAWQVWPILILWLALTPIEVVRARQEDRVLREAFGVEYEAYRKKTWF